MLRRFIPSKPRTREPDWNALYAEFLPRIHRFFCYRVSDGPTAEDLTSATFEKAWQARYRYRDDLAAFSTWLFTIARNLATDHFRRQREQVPLDDLHDTSDEPSLDEAADRSADFATLLRLLRQLPDRERDIVALKFGGDYTHRDIARLMGLSEGNIAVIAHRTVTHLRQQWPTEFKSQQVVSTKAHE